MEFVEQLKSSIDIVDVVGQFVRLKKSGSGNRWVGLCPFHSEKSPSFSVHGGHQFYKCFGCGVGGDAIKFVMEIERLSFYEALEWLSARYGVPMPKKHGPAQDEDTKLRAALYRMHELAQGLFRRNLEAEPGKPAREYLAKRGLSREQGNEFGIGYSAASWDQLLSLLRKEGFDDAELEASGLVVRRQEGSGFYDRFRNRLMFPIQGDSGKIIAFAGRGLSPEDQPKYMNSPETPIYRKSYVLYNLHRAKDAMRRGDRVVLVEGYMDVIGVYSAGVQEVVASCGTSLTEQQARLLKRYASQVVVNFDPDSAGANAAERSIQIFLAEDLRVRVLALEGELDPDEYVRQHGASQYQEKLEEAKPYFYWLADRARRKFDMKTGEGRLAALQFLLPALNRVSGRIERMTLANDLASYLGIPAGLILEEFRKTVDSRGQEVKAAAAGAGLARTERILLHWLLEGEQARDHVISLIEEAPYLERFRSCGILRAIFHLHALKPAFRYHDLEERLEESDRDLLSKVVMDDELGKEPFSHERAEELLRVFDHRFRQVRLQELRAQVQEAERAGDLNEALRLTQELQSLGEIRR